MDPDAALNDLITFILTGEFSEAEERLEALREWRDRGSFPPKDPRPGEPQPVGVGWSTR